MGKDLKPIERAERVVMVLKTIEDLDIAMQKEVLDRAKSIVEENGKG